MAVKRKLTPNDYRVIQKVLFEDLAGKVNQTKVLAGNEWVNYLVADKTIGSRDEVTAYVTSTHQRNRWADIERFHAYMEKSIKRWDKRFIYVSGSDNVMKLMLEAVEFIEKHLRSRLELKFPNRITGRYQDSIKQFVDGLPYATNIMAMSKIREMNGDAVYEVTNTVAYASTNEARAYFNRGGGIFFYVANRVQRRFPQLGVEFNYVQQNVAVGHKYNMPIITIGPKSLVDGREWSRPGENSRRRKKIHRSNQRKADRLREKFGAT